MDRKAQSEAAACCGRKKLKNDIIFTVTLLVAVCLAALVLLLVRTEGDTVIVTVDGELYGEYSLKADQTVEIKSGDGYNLLVVEGGRAYVKSASCPDGICAAHRPVSHNGESIICLPNKVVVEIRTASDSQPDIIA